MTKRVTSDKTVPPSEVIQAPPALTKEQQAERDRRVKIKTMKIRTTMGFLILFSVLTVMMLGHTFTIIGVGMTTCTMYFEVMSVNDNEEIQKKSRVKYTQWMFYLISMFILAPHQIFRRSILDEIFSTDSLLQKILFEYHLLISFGLAMILMILMVFNLIHFGNFQYQVKTWAKAIISALIFASTLAAYAYTIQYGYFWFLFSVLAVSNNDAMAYFFGQAFGKTPLIKLSPKKTWEGFIGGTFSCIIWCFFSSWYLSRYQFMICPQPYYKMSFFEEVSCTPHEIYVNKHYEFNFGPFGVHQFDVAPVQFYSLAISLFASLIAPFGGFLASGFKRAFRVKDFADTIPGHGGITDRMDCKVMMGWFLYFYLSQFVFKEQNHVELAYRQYQDMNQEDKIRFLATFNNLVAQATANITV